VYTVLTFCNPAAVVFFSHWSPAQVSWIVPSAVSVKQPDTRVVVVVVVEVELLVIVVDEVGAPVVVVGAEQLAPVAALHAASASVLHATFCRLRVALHAFRSAFDRTLQVLGSGTAARQSTIVFRHTFAQLLPLAWSGATRHAARMPTRMTMERIANQHSSVVTGLRKGWAREAVAGTPRASFGLSRCRV
jgi:hypothetical protein